MAGTKIVKNGHPDERAVQWGVLFRVATWIAAVFAVVVAGCALAGMNRLFWMSATIERIDERTLQSQEAIDELKAVLVKRDSDERVLHDSYLTKEEFDREMQPEVKRHRQ